MNDNVQVREIAGNYYEDFEIGYVRTSPGRTLTAADVIAFSGITGDYSQVHTDAEYMKDSQFGQCLVHGLLGLSVAQGLCWRTNYTDGTGVASLEWSNWKFRLPIYFNDTVHVRWWATDKRESRSQPDVGIVVERVELRNQRDEVVQDGNHVIMVQRRVSGIGKGKKQ